MSAKRAMGLFLGTTVHRRLRIGRALRHQEA